MTVRFFLLSALMMWAATAETFISRGYLSSFSSRGGYKSGTDISKHNGQAVDMRQLVESLDISILKTFGGGIGGKPNQSFGSAMELITARCPCPCCSK